MTNIKQIDNKTIEITGNEVKELVDVALSKVRLQSKDYYKKEIEKDLIENKKSLIDLHAGMGYYYHIILQQ